ncbi:transposase [Actinoplanes sp. NEAU-A12]|uniref:Transposase n=1 Tax=Actinoplanes sandaracinus TaxID=3045177 RepID=A0ABT6WHK2_9ACTN|nr:transposase [Actinoplanes sandaracinus]MDI6099210.1 transposase [Actinoplanes sandaracinus]
MSRRLRGLCRVLSAWPSCSCSFLPSSSEFLPRERTTPAFSANRVSTEVGRSARSFGVRDRLLDLLKSLRRRWPGETLYLILDNFAAHKQPSVWAWCAANAVELVFLPTYSSGLNWIEAEFAALRYFALNGTDHQ